MAKKHNKKFEIAIAVLGMMGGAILPFPALIGWGFLVFAIVNLLMINSKYYCGINRYFF